MASAPGCTTILSFDPASYRNIGWSLFHIKEGPNGDQLSCQAGTIVIEKVLEPWHALWPMFVNIDAVLGNQSPEIIIIEKTSSFSGGFVTGQVSNCTGVILACCGKYELPVDFVYPTHVKKVVSGNGRATKAQMKKSVRDFIFKITGETIKFDSEHACDATANIICWLMENKMAKDNQDNQNG